ncbi:MAG: KH domain-containing protein [bacterium]|nr:KH domain-containing protein [bacterium]
MEQDEKFLDYVVKALVDNPNDVKINRTVDEMGVLLTLSVHKDDMGKVIGRSGATAKAIRTVLRVVGMKNDARVNLKIEEPEGSEPREGRGERSMGGAGEIDSGPAKPYVRDTTVDDVIKDLKGE